MNLTKALNLFFLFYLNNLCCNGRKRNENLRNELETFPYLFNVTFIKEITQNYNYFRVYLNNTVHKGHGVFASRRIPSNRTVMYYKLKIFEQKRYQRVGDGKYSLVVMKRSKDSFIIDENKVADIYEGSNPKPKGRIPFWVCFVSNSIIFLYLFYRHILLMNQMKMSYQIVILF